MDAVCLKLNESKTEFIYLISRQQSTKCHPNTVNIKGEIINRSTKVKNLGGYLDEQLNFKQHVPNFIIVFYHSLFQLVMSIKECLWY